MDLIFRLLELEPPKSRIQYMSDRADDRWLGEQTVQPTDGAWNVICTDFFTYSPDNSYDVIFDYT